LRFRRRRRTSGHGRAQSEASAVDDSDSIRDRHEGTWTRLELIEMDERFRQAMRRGHSGMERHEPERRQGVSATRMQRQIELTCNFKVPRRNHNP
jgi:hypothetical protein